MTKNRLLNLFALLLLLIIAWLYAQVALVGPEWTEAVVLSRIEKPFVYRALLPWLARGLMSLGWSAENALTILVVGSALGVWYGLDYLRKAVQR